MVVDDDDDDGLMGSKLELVDANRDKKEIDCCEERAVLLTISLHASKCIRLRNTMEHGE